MEICHNYTETLREYKKILRLKKFNHYNENLREIEDSIDNNQFWEQWNKLSNRSTHNLAIQDYNTWKAHFKSVYKQTNINKHSQFGTEQNQRKTEKPRINYQKQSEPT